MANLLWEERRPKRATEQLFLATSLASIPSLYRNGSWIWQKTLEMTSSSASRLLGEISQNPFSSLSTCAKVGVAVSTLFAIKDVANREWRAAGKKVLLAGLSLGTSFGIDYFTGSTWPFAKS